VFPNGRWSPFARSREDAYELDEATGNERALDGFESILQTLPVPLVGIPWYQLAHLPDAVFIGHEVGHLVEHDFELEEQLQAVLGAALPEKGHDAVPEERRRAWILRWRSEVFADAYGVLTTGPAFRNPPGSPRRRQDTDRGGGAAGSETPGQSAWSDYPTRALRASLVCEAVAQLDGDKATPDIFRNQAAALRASWDAALKLDGARAAQLAHEA
jgi:hypothetical protein